MPRDAACWPIRPGGLGGGKHAVLAKACGDRAYKHLHAINIRPAWSGVITFTVFPSLYPIAENQASNKTRCARRGVNSRSTRRARPRLPQPTPHAPVPSRSLKEAGAEICYEPPSKLEGATQPCPPVRHGAGLLDTTVYSRVDAHPGRRDPKERCARGTGRNPARLLHSRHGPFRTLSAARAPPRLPRPPRPAFRLQDA